MLCMLVGVVTVNLTVKAGEFLFFPPLLFAIIVLVSLLATILMTSLGMLASLRAETVKQAYQGLSIGFLILWFTPILVLQVAPPEWKTMLFQTLSRIDLGLAALIFAGILFAADVILMAIVIQRFHRTKLLLD
jgi:hypothetical protein